jgi:hypothetical protein
MGWNRRPGWRGSGRSSRHVLFVVAMLLGLLFVPQAPAAILSGSLSPTGGAVDLTTEGTQDWALWGYAASGTSTSLAPDVRKAGGSAISDLTDINPTAVPRRGLGQFPALVPFTFGWSNGAPTAAAALAYAGLQRRPASLTTTVNDGFVHRSRRHDAADGPRLRVRTLGTGTPTATLSDGSAPAFVDSGVTGPTNGANVPGVHDHVRRGGGRPDAHRRVDRVRLDGLHVLRGQRRDLRRRPRRACDVHRQYELGRRRPTPAAR